MVLCFQSWTEKSLLSTSNCHPSQLNLSLYHQWLSLLYWAKRSLHHCKGITLSLCKGIINTSRSSSSRWTYTPLSTISHSLITTSCRCQASQPSNNRLHKVVTLQIAFSIKVYATHKKKTRYSLPIITQKSAILQLFPNATNIDSNLFTEVVTQPNYIPIKLYDSQTDF